MDFLDEGKDTPPEPEEYQVLFVDMWGGWVLYEDYYGTFDSRIKEYVQDRQCQTSYFNPNYIKTYKCG